MHLLSLNKFIKLKSQINFQNFLKKLLIFQIREEILVKSYKFKLKLI